VVSGKSTVRTSGSILGVQSDVAVVRDFDGAKVGDVGSTKAGGVGGTKLGDSGGNVVGAPCCVSLGVLGSTATG